jgi:hypothetical protein
VASSLFRLLVGGRSNGGVQLAAKEHAGCTYGAAEVICIEQTSAAAFARGKSACICSVFNWYLLLLLLLLLA